MTNDNNLIVIVLRVTFVIMLMIVEIQCGV